jgi:hypothetical protein
MGAEFMAHLLDEQVADPVTDHGCPSSLELLRTEDTPDGRSLGARLAIGEGETQFADSESAMLRSGAGGST